MPNSPSPWIIPVVVASAYALGSISPGWWLVRRRTGVDLRDEGSGRTGATNAARLIGKGGYAAVLILDTLKGLAAVVGARLLAPEVPWTGLAGPAVVAGHIWPLWLKFKGGRGAATFMGVTIGFNLWIVPLAWVLGLAAGLITHKSFNARAVAFIASLPIGWYFIHDLPSHISFLLAWMLVLLAHRSYLGKHLPG